MIFQKFKFNFSRVRLLLSFVILIGAVVWTFYDWQQGVDFPFEPLLAVIAAVIPLLEWSEDKNQDTTRSVIRINTAQAGRNVKATNQQSGDIVMKDVQAGHSIDAKGRTGEIDLENVKAEAGSIEAKIDNERT